MSSVFAETQPSDSELQASAGGWSSVTWDDVQEWAGSRNVLRGRAYQRRGHVREMIHTSDGRLMATVVGNDKYQVSVWRTALDTGGDLLQSHCTCPVGHNHCKHAVAVIAEYFQSLADEQSPPAVAEQHPVGEQNGDDSGLNRIEPAAAVAPSESESPAEHSPAAAVLHPKASSWDGSLKDNLRAKSHEELVELVASLLQRFSELRAEVRERLGETLQPPGH